jgi:protein SDA1
LLGDLIEYRKSRDKGVVTASRGLLQLFREVNPGLLKRRERGKAASMGMSTDQVPEYGHSRGTAEGIDGLNVSKILLFLLRSRSYGLLLSQP